MTLPEAFIADIQPYLSAPEFADFCQALTTTEQTTSVRINPAKGAAVTFDDATAIGWNPVQGYYLHQRPNFTLDPRMHAGCYYVQEASSQFVVHVVRNFVDGPVTALDLCAAPGGKSTALLSAMPIGSVLVSNEIDRRRARILAENITKWGNPNVVVTSNAPADFIGLHYQFDLVLTDVPCSGEGMFRKDEGAVADWSPQKVKGCVALQHQILANIWDTLRPGGLLIYSTCTFNIHEDEEMLDYICNELGAEALTVPTDPQWHIHPPLVGTLPCYRFMPHYTQGEGLFMAVVRKTTNGNNIQRKNCDGLRPSTSANNKHKAGKKGKTQSNAPAKLQLDKKKATTTLSTQLTIESEIEFGDEGSIRAIPQLLAPLHSALQSQGLYLLQSGIEMGTIKGKDIIPAHALALSNVRSAEAFPVVDVELETALNYLRHEAICLPPEAPNGYVIVSYQQHALGFVKNLGNRCNSLYPQEWRIRHL